MTRVMFVCHGNICRSPMAEFIMKKLVRDAGRESEFIIASSATSTEEIWNGVGNPVYPPAREELKKHGIECGGKRAVQLTAADAEKYDLFLCMDSANLRNAKRILGQKAEGKVKKLLDLAGGGDVADPWYSDRFDIAYADILRGCEALIKSI
ncbi:MAG: low molecular weight phosphotyrosine protein phosphatase [Ruminococcaceae bacterium]|nr:low molecular weight phosphotyrosine protein phosphatase [Oscillospiraceae bacterium]